LIGQYREHRAARLVLSLRRNYVVWAASKKL
jgi:hypothetical protein